MLEKVDDPNGEIIKSVINISHSFAIGYVFHRPKITHNVFYKNATFAIGLPRWSNKQYGNSHWTVGPYRIHAFGYSLEKILLSGKNKKFHVKGLAGISIGYLPGNKWDLNEVPSDSSFIGWENHWDNDSLWLFKSDLYNRQVSDISLNVNLGINFEFALSKRLRFSIIPRYSIGFINIYQVDTWYHDYILGKGGHATIKSKGSNVGVLVRATYIFPRPKKEYEGSFSM